MAIYEPPDLQSEPQSRPDPRSESDAELRDRAIKRLKKRRDFYGHLVAYVTVNSFVILIWAVTDLHGFFWPLFLLAGWGVGLVMNAWDVWRSEDLREDRIEREMRRLKSSR